MVNYGYYKGIYFGKKIEDADIFLRLAKRAELTLRHKTFGRTLKVKDEEVLEIIKWTICELVDIYSDEDNFDIIKSEKLDDSSITYRDRDKDLKKLEVDTIRRNLEFTGLLRRGWR